MPNPLRSAAALVLLGIAACASGPKGPTREQQIELYTQNARQYFAMDEFERAEDQCRRGLALDPDNLMLQLVLGWSLLRRDTTEDILAAERVFRRIVRQDDYRASLGLADALFRKGQLQDEAARGIASGDRSTEARDPMARSEELAEDARQAWEASIVEYERTLQRKPGDRRATAGLARVNALLGHDDQSVQWSEKLLAELDETARFWRRNLEREDITAQEEASYRKLLAESVDLEIVARLQTASVLRRLGQDDRALEELGRVAELSPELPEVHSRRAQLLFEEGRYEAALAALDRFLALTERDFDDPVVRRALDLRGECEEAIATAREGEAETTAR